MSLTAAMALGAGIGAGLYALTVALTTLYYERVYLPRIAGED